MKIMVLGASGMLGHIMTKYLEENGHDVIGVSRSGSFGALPVAINLENWPSLQKEIANYRPEWVINAAGLLNDEVDKNLSSAILINSFLPQKLAEAGPELGFRLITIGSDCVFQGDRGAYSIQDNPDAQSAYGKTKHVGEVNNEYDLTIRTSIIGPEIDPKGRGLLLWFMSQAEQADGWTAAHWTGVTTLELAKIIEKIVSGNIHEVGLWQCVPSQPITKFELLGLMNATFRQGDIVVNSVPGVPHDRSLINDRPNAWNVPVYPEMMSELKNWILSHQDIYQGTVFELQSTLEDLETP